MEKVFFTFITVIAAVFVVNWTFNHINAWVAIAMGLSFIYLSIKQLKKLLK